MIILVVVRYMVSVWVMQVYGHGCDYGKVWIVVRVAIALLGRMMETIQVAGCQIIGG